MKKILLTIAALATLFSCSSIDEVADKYAAGDYVESVEMTVEDFEEDATTRTALSNLTDTGAKFAWAENDTVGIFPNVGDQVSFSMAAGAGTSSATFNGGGWALRTSSSYSAYYPFSRANFYRDSKTIAINMVGQTQNGNDDTSEIGAFDIMAAAPASAETGNVKFAFKHQVSICRIKLTLPENKSFKSVKVIAPSKKFITEAKLDISVATPTITATKTSEEISLSLRNFSTTSTNKNLVANMYVLPVDMSADKLTVEVTDVDGNVYTAENVTGVNFEKAKIRILNAVPTAPGGDGEGEGEDFTGDENLPNETPTLKLVENEWKFYNLHGDLITNTPNLIGEYVWKTQSGKVFYDRYDNDVSPVISEHFQFVDGAWHKVDDSLGTGYYDRFINGNTVFYDEKSKNTFAHSSRGLCILTTAGHWQQYSFKGDWDFSSHFKDLKGYLVAWNSEGVGHYYYLKDDQWQIYLSAPLGEVVKKSSAVWYHDGHVYASYRPSTSSTSISHYELIIDDQKDQRWVKKSWEGFKDFTASQVWHDADNNCYCTIGCSSNYTHIEEIKTYILSNNTWIEINVEPNFPFAYINDSFPASDQIWTDGINTYYDFRGKHYKILH